MEIILVVALVIFAGFEVFIGIVFIDYWKSIKSNHDRYLLMEFERILKENAKRRDAYEIAGIVRLLEKDMKR